MATRYIYRRTCPLIIVLSIMSENNYATTGSLNYFLPAADGSRLYNYINADSTTGERRRNWVEDPRVVDIENVRGSEDQYKLDTAGFQFGRQASQHTRFLDDKEIEAEYYPECIELIKKITGASSAVIFDHSKCLRVSSSWTAMLTTRTLAIRRRRPGQIDDSPDKRQPVSLVHVDQTNASSVARVHRHLPASDAPALLKRRFQIINLWRPIAHTALDWPLALCDFRSVDVKSDLLPVALIYPDREGETFGVKFNQAHKWKYMRGMEPDEFALIKWYAPFRHSQEWDFDKDTSSFDSVQDGSVAILTPHSGFQDPNSPEGAPLRESIEVRALVFYDN